MGIFIGSIHNNLKLETTKFNGKWIGKQIATYTNDVVLSDD